MNDSNKYYDVFLSYSHNDSEELTRNIYSSLVKKGLRVFIDDVEILTGDIIIEKIIDAINDSKIFVAIISDSYSKSGWCKHEMIQVLVDYANKSNVDILPFRINDAEIPRLLSIRKYSSYTNSIKNGEFITKDILNVVRRSFRDFNIQKSVLDIPSWLEQICELGTLARRCCSHIIRDDEKEFYLNELEEIYYKIAKIRTEFSTQITDEFYDDIEELQNATYRGPIEPVRERERIEKTTKRIIKKAQERFK